MTPPTDLAPWATDQTNNTPPSSSQKASGWTPGQDGVSSYDNWWKHAIHVWIVFINALFDALGNVFLPASLTTAGSLTVSGNATVAGGATVTGPLAVTGASTMSGLIAANAGVTAGADQHVKVTGTGRHKHDTETLVIDGAAFHPITVSTSVDLSGNGCKFTGGLGVAAFAPILVGRRMTAVRFNLKDSASGPTTLQCVAGPRSSTTDHSVFTNSTNGSGTDQQLVTTFGFGGGHGGGGMVQTSMGVLLKVIFATGTAQCIVYNVEIDYDLL